MQNHYNLLYREEEREMVPTLKVKHSGLSPCTHSLSKGVALYYSILASVQSRGLRLPAVLSHTPSESAQFALMTTSGRYSFISTEKTSLTPLV